MGKAAAIDRGRYDGMQNNYRWTFSAQKRDDCRRHGMFIAKKDRK
jgi:hypothetical protein